MRLYRGGVTSTTFITKHVKIEPAARPKEPVRAKRARKGLGPRRSATEPVLPRSGVYVRICYRGGGEAFWAITRGSETYLVAGWVPLHDAMAFVFDCLPTNDD